jgi:hypothetical protein
LHEAQVADPWELAEWGHDVRDVRDLQTVWHRRPVRTIVSNFLGSDRIRMTQTLRFSVTHLMTMEFEGEESWQIEDASAEGRLSMRL